MNMKKRLLVIDDESAIRKFLRISLESHGYSIAEASLGKEGLLQATFFKPDVVILDLSLPDIDGTEVLMRLREWTQSPIIVLTVRDGEEDKVKVLDAGADDYMTKPFSVLELLARLRVAERHALGSKESISLFQNGPLEVDLIGRIVKIGGGEIHLTATEYNILKLLIDHAGKVVTHHQLLKQVWGDYSLLHTQYVRVYVGHLRKKLRSSQDASHLIVTEPGVGYRLRLYP
ncbi:MAG: response regulator [Deltaproteobacteria bacterium]|nr:response regulator [Deltaproteobacteria bacterium]